MRQIQAPEAVVGRRYRTPRGQDVEVLAAHPDGARLRVLATGREIDVPAIYALLDDEDVGVGIEDLSALPPDELIARLPDLDDVTLGALLDVEGRIPVQVAIAAEQDRRADPKPLAAPETPPPAPETKAPPPAPVEQAPLFRAAARAVEVRDDTAAAAATAAIKAASGPATAPCPLCSTVLDLASPSPAEVVPAHTTQHGLRCAVVGLPMEEARAEAASLQALWPILFDGLETAPERIEAIKAWTDLRLVSAAAAMPDLQAAAVREVERQDLALTKARDGVGRLAEAEGDEARAAIGAELRSWLLGRQARSRPGVIEVVTAGLAAAGEDVGQDAPPDSLYEHLRRRSWPTDEEFAIAVHACTSSIRESRRVIAAETRPDVLAAAYSWELAAGKRQTLLSMLRPKMLEAEPAEADGGAEICDDDDGGASVEDDAETDAGDGTAAVGADKICDDDLPPGFADASAARQVELVEAMDLGDLRRRWHVVAAAARHALVSEAILRRVKEPDEAAPAPSVPADLVPEAIRQFRLPDGAVETWGAIGGRRVYLGRTPPPAPATASAPPPTAAAPPPAPLRSRADDHVRAAQDALAALAAGLPAMKALGLSVEITIRT